LLLSDGMGHGIKANLLATLTATLSVHLAIEHKEVEKIAEIVMNTLPVDSVKETELCHLYTGGIFLMMGECADPGI